MTYVFEHLLEVIEDVAPLSVPLGEVLVAHATHAVRREVVGAPGAARPGTAGPVVFVVGLMRVRRIRRRAAHRHDASVGHVSCACAAVEMRV